VLTRRRRDGSLPGKRGWAPVPQGLPTRGSWGPHCGPWCRRVGDQAVEHRCAPKHTITCARGVTRKTNSMNATELSYRLYRIDDEEGSASFCVSLKIYAIARAEYARTEGREDRATFPRPSMRQFRAREHA